MEELKNKIIKIIAKELDVSPRSIKDNTLIQEDLGADSLDVIHIVMIIENSFNIEINEDTLTEFKAVGDIVNRLSTIVN